MAPDGTEATPFDLLTELRFISHSTQNRSFRRRYPSPRTHTAPTPIMLAVKHYYSSTATTTQTCFVTTTTTTTTTTITTTVYGYYTGQPALAGTGVKNWICCPHALPVGN